MKTRSAMFLALMLACGSASATERYTEARINQVETSDLGIYVFLQIVSGDATPVGNAGTNEPLAKSYLILANAADIPLRQHLLATALVALTQGTIVRFRWDDAGPDPARITHILVRSN